MFDREVFDEARKEFLTHLRYAKGHRETTCYAYHSDLGLWRDWLQAAGKDWQRARAADVEQFAAWQLRERKVSAHIVTRRLSTLSSFYKWALKHEIVESDPVYLADKPKRPSAFRCGWRRRNRPGWKRPSRIGATFRSTSSGTTSPG